MDISGNEKADREAKHAADGNSSDSTDLPKYVHKKIKHCISALRQANNKQVNEAWKREWQDLKGYRCLRATDTATPSSQKFITLISNHRIPHHTASLIFQLRVGHALLNGYLYRIKRVDSADAQPAETNAEQRSTSCSSAPSTHMSNGCT
jgi:hypothetical protein